MSGPVVCPDGMEEVQNYGGEVICRIARIGHHVLQERGPCGACGAVGWNTHPYRQKWYCGEDCCEEGKRKRRGEVHR